MLEIIAFSKCSLTTFASLGDDILVHQDKENPQWLFSVGVTEDGKYLVMYISKDCSKVRYAVLLLIQLLMSFQQNLLWIANFDENSIGPNIKWIKLVDKFVSRYTVYVSNHPIHLPFN